VESDGLGLFDRAAFFKIRRDAGGAEGVAADAGRESGGFGPALDHVEGVVAAERPAGQLLAPAIGRARSEGIASVDFIAVAARGGSKLAGLTWGEKTCSANLADTERNERQAFKRQPFSAAKSEMAYHNHFVLNSLGGNAKSAMPVLSLVLSLSHYQ
jgi:hypothetical protein